MTGGRGAWVSLAGLAAAGAFLAGGCSTGETDASVAGREQVVSEESVSPTSAPPTSTPATAVSATSTSVVPADLDTDVDTEAAVRVSFERYRQALLEQDPEAASAVVNQRTFEVYQDILDLSLDADATQLLEDVPLSLAFNAFASRAFLGEELLDLADGRALFEVGVERGLIGDNVATIQITGVTIGGVEAFGLVEGEPALRFEFEGGRWLVDVAYVSEFAFDRDEGAIIAALTGGSGRDRADLFEAFSPAFGGTWADFSQPVR